MENKSLLRQKEHFKDHDYYHLFSQVDTRAYFDYQTYTLHLSEVTKKSGEATIGYLFNKPNKVISNEEYFVMSDALSLLTHEYTHFIDFSSTIFGLEHIGKLAAAAASEHTRDEYEFYHAKKYSDHLRTLRPSKYYDQKFNSNIPREQWGTILSSGVLFNSSGKPSSRPITFIRFLTPENIQIARSPISPISILEASAIAQELLAEIELARKSEDPEIKYRDINQKNIDFLYNASLTDYSVCAHLVANSIACKDILMVARILAVLTRVVLNTPPAVFDDINRTIDKTPYFLSLKGVEGEAAVKGRIRSGLKYRDLGTLFFLMTCCMPKAPTSPEEFGEFIYTTLSLTGYSAGWREKSKQHALQLNRFIQSCGVNHLAVVANCGVNNFEKINNSRYGIDISDLHVPPCFIERDAEKLSIPNSPINNLANQNIEEMYELGSQIELWVDKMVSACINMQ